MQTILDKLTENMQNIYRKALDADQSLSKLQQSGKGKYRNVFTDESGFNTKSKRFMPYVEELAGEIAPLAKAEKADIENALPSIVKKMELLLVTLANFQQSLKR
jgi:primosomal protein N''